MPASFRGKAASTPPETTAARARPCSTEGARCQRPIPGAPCTVDEDCIGISGSMGERSADIIHAGNDAPAETMT